ncbi:hypothetical protein CONLIGDRAFT_331104 [Coniochaeta ligniaria NRRL 30616]|uniref:Uncharacterized protein n=1 Tax=Coniochaeta ligniaria NRRL 30616 TaxID=1408157 RepID=A0A1J7JJR2_9PEZI|nr:hypothetical protein CONLIGDRAFT_331104 [Coniochaeta ligniaria NRRL 30616]
MSGRQWGKWRTAVEIQADLMSIGSGVLCTCTCHVHLASGHSEISPPPPPTCRPKGKHGRHARSQVCQRMSRANQFDTNGSREGGRVSGRRPGIEKGRRQVCPPGGYHSGYHCSKSWSRGRITPAICKRKY